MRRLRCERPHWIYSALLSPQVLGVCVHNQTVLSIVSWDPHEKQNPVVIFFSLTAWCAFTSRAYPVHPSLKPRVYLSDQLSDICFIWCKFHQPVIERWMDSTSPLGVSNQNQLISNTPSEPVVSDPESKVKDKFLFARRCTGTLFAVKSCPKREIPLATELSWEKVSHILSLRY